MKIRSADELQEFLDKDLEWRRREMTRLLLAAKSAKGDLKITFIRAGVCIVYAHFEGFIKGAATAYLKLVHSRGDSLSRLKDNFIAIAHRAAIAECGTTKKAKVFNKLVTALVSSKISKETLKFRSDLVDTQSNLKSAILRDIFALTGLDYSAYETRENLFDNVLLTNRNKIAHGEIVSLDEESYEKLHSVVISTLDELKTDLENAAYQKSYLRETPLP